MKLPHELAEEFIEAIIGIPHFFIWRSFEILLRKEFSYNVRFYPQTQELSATNVIDIVCLYPDRIFPKCKISFDVPNLKVSHPQYFYAALMVLWHAYLEVSTIAKQPDTQTLANIAPSSEKERQTIKEQASAFASSFCKAYNEKLKDDSWVKKHFSMHERYKIDKLEFRLIAPHK